MAVSTPLTLHLSRLMQRARQVPPWALLSLAMNGMLFLTVLVALRQGSGGIPVTAETPLPSTTAEVGSLQAGAATAAEIPASTPQLGERLYLDYQQWVALLQGEIDAAVARQAVNQTILLGDSLSLWFPPDLLPGRRTWLNQGISGEGAAGVRRRLPMLDATTPEAVFIMVGINDLIWERPEADLLANLRASVVYLQQQHPEARVVLQSILPHGGERATWESKDRLLQVSPAQIRAVNRDIAAMAADTGATYLDLYPLFADGEGYLRPDMTTDGIHLSERGYIVWRTAIALLNESDQAFSDARP